MWGLVDELQFMQDVLGTSTHLLDKSPVDACDAGHIGGHCAQSRMLRSLQLACLPSSQALGHAWPVVCQPVSAVMAYKMNESSLEVQHVPPVVIQQPVALLLLPDDHWQSHPSIALLSDGGRSFVAMVALAGKFGCTSSSHNHSQVLAWM